MEQVCTKQRSWLSVSSKIRNKGYGAFGCGNRKRYSWYCSAEAGAKHVVGTDLDPCAVPAVSENREANGIPGEAFTMMIGNIIDDKEVQDKAGYEKYDIVAANILADVLLPLTPVIVNQMKTGHTISLREFWM